MSHPYLPTTSPSTLTSFPLPPPSSDGHGPLTPHSTLLLYKDIFLFLIHEPPAAASALGAPPAPPGAGWGGKERDAPTFTPSPPRGKTRAGGTATRASPPPPPRGDGRLCPRGCGAERSQSSGGAGGRGAPLPDGAVGRGGRAGGARPSRAMRSPAEPRGAPRQVGLAPHGAVGVREGLGGAAGRQRERSGEGKGAPGKGSPGRGEPRGSPRRGSPSSPFSAVRQLARFPLESASAN